MWETNPKLKKLLIVLIVILVLSGIVLLILAQVQTVYRQKIYEQTESALPKHEVRQATTTTPSMIKGWNVYTNETYRFQLQYPTGVDVGAKVKSINLGTYQDPVYGIEIGGGQLVPLVTPELKSKALGIMAQMEYYSNNSGQTKPGEMPQSVTCVSQPIENPYMSTEAVYCTGEGGPAYYAYLSGGSMDFFYDGYAGKVIDNPTANKILGMLRLVP